jgi:transcriptional regulator with XRE-family HTH domain
MQVHEYLRKLRTDNAYKQEYVAKQLGLTQQAYSKMESGETKTISPDIQARLAKLYKMPVSNFDRNYHTVASQQLTPEKEKEYLNKIIGLQSEIIELQRNNGKK